MLLIIDVEIVDGEHGMTEQQQIDSIMAAALKIDPHAIRATDDVCVAAFGDAFNGLCLRGPFVNSEALREYAEPTGDLWHAVPVEPPC